MAETTWTLMDRDNRVCVDQLEVTPDMIDGPASGFRVEKRRLHGGLSNAVDVVHIDNGALSFDVLPTRGMGIWKARVGDLPIGWNSPVPGPVHPAFVPLGDPSGLGWLDGFDELLVRCGLESNGAPEFDDRGILTYGLHGRIANKPAHYLEVRVDGDSGDITIAGIVDEIRFHFFKLRLFTTIRTRIGQKSIQICDTVENLSASPTDVQMLYHINVGPPLLGPGAKVVAPVKSIVPRNSWAAESLASWDEYVAPAAGTEEQVYFFEMQAGSESRSKVLLRNAQSDCGFSVEYDAAQLPCFTLWKNPTAEADGYVTGLEPATNYPNSRSFEKAQGRTVALGPGATCSFNLCLDVQTDAAEVAAAEDSIKTLSVADPVVFDQPQKGWCADA